VFDLARADSAKVANKLPEKISHLKLTALQSVPVQEAPVLTK